MKIGLSVRQKALSAKNLIFPDFYSWRYKAFLVASVLFYCRRVSYYSKMKERFNLLRMFFLIKISRAVSEMVER